MKNKEKKHYVIDKNMGMISVILN